MLKQNTLIFLLHCGIQWLQAIFGAVKAAVIGFEYSG